MIWFTDASALVKRYVNETGSQWFRSELSNHQIVIAQITCVELIAALTRRFRKGEITKLALYQARKRFLIHRAHLEYEIIETDDRVIEEAIRIAFTHGLKAYDAVQLATAMVAAKQFDTKRYVFVAADHQLLTAATNTGLPIETPLNH